jgi:hypothetical protein
VKRLAALLLLAGLLAGSPFAQDAPAAGEGPFFVYMGSFSTKSAAQNHAAEFGGWVLRTDLYTGLTPGFYAAVIGPFRERADAELALEEVRLIQPDALVRSAGPSRLPAALGDPALLAAVLGELAVVVNADTTTVNPCAPTEPYVTILVGFVLTVFGEEDAPLGGFWMIERTGEVIPIRGCVE